MKAEYRSDIDGLRAVAVLLVVAFHAFPRYVPAGFIGVDIFFVISGFLISRLIYKDLEGGTFSLLDFWARRIKRIFPALIVVLLACATAGAGMLFPDEYQSLGKHIFGGAGFVANFVLLGEVGYFDDVAENKPLLHLWSLGIEEQFYLLWPVVMLACARWKKDPFGVAAVICLGSFAWNVVLSATNAGAAFYLPVTRFWELMLGCMLAFLTSRDASDASGGVSGLVSLRRLAAQHRGIAMQAAAWLGAALIVASVAFISRDRLFPGWWALLPTLGAALLIGAAPSSSFFRWLLSNRALVYVGLISYPLYLWHWSILSFLRIAQIREPTVLAKLAAVGMAFALAALTYRFVERPIRFGSPASMKPLVALLVLVVTGCLGATIYAEAGFPQRYGPDLQTAIRAPVPLTDLNCQQGSDKARIELGASCVMNGGGTGKIALWGDSHAAFLSPGFEDATRRSDSNFAAFVHAGCPPVISFSSTERPDCKAFNDAALQRFAAWKPDTVVLAARWEFYRGFRGWGTVDPDAIRSTISRLGSMGIPRVVVIGQIPVWFGAPWRIRARLLRMEPLRMFAGNAATPLPTRDKTYLRPSTFQADEQIKSVVRGTGAVFVSPLPTLCNEEGCLLVVRNGGESLAVRDGDGHLTTEGAIFFVKENAELIFGP